MVVALWDRARLAEDSGLELSHGGSAACARLPTWWPPPRRSTRC
jgi:hypothetical protein